MTSQGAAGPLPAKNRIEAEWACLLYGNVRVEEGADGKELLSGIHHADRACYKYIDFGDGADSLILRISPGSGPGRLVLCTGQPWHQDIAVAEVPAAQKDREWSVLSVPLNTNVTGIHAVWLKFYGEGGEDLFRLDWFRFH